MLTTSVILVLGITFVALILFATEFLPVDVTAFLVMVALMLTGILTPQEGLSGFSNVGTISVFALLVLGISFQSTGVVNYIGDRMERWVGPNELKTISIISLFSGVFSAFLNNTAIVAVLMPVCSRLSKFTNISVSKLLMPLSFSAMVGGTLTVIGTSTNVLVSGIYQDHYGLTIGIFEFFKIGLILFAAYMVYMLTIGRWLLPGEQADEEDLTKSYDVNQYLTQIKVLPDSPMAGTAVSNTEMVSRYNMRIIEIDRAGEKFSVPEDSFVIHTNDILVIKAYLEDLIELRERQKIRIVRKEKHLDEQDLTSEEAVLFEAVIGRNSFLVGQYLRDIDFIQLFQAVPLAIRRSGTALSKKISEVKIQFGDTLLLEARRSNLDKFVMSPDFIVMEKVKKPNFRRDKMLLSLIIVFEVIILAALNVMPLVLSALLGCALLFLTNCVSMKYVYRKMEWRVIFLLAGILPLGLAFEKTGTSQMIANGILGLVGDMSVNWVISCLFIITTLLTSFMSNNATAILLAPIGINMAQQLGLDPKPFLITIMFAASTSFITPIGYQTNTLIYGPGKYTFMDFVRVGGLLTLIVWFLISILIPYFYF